MFNQNFDDIRLTKPPFQVTFMTFLIIVVLAAYSEKTLAAGIFDNVPINLISLYAKHKIMPSNDLIIKLGHTDYTMDNVPITITSKIKNIKSIVILAIENLHPLVAVFNVNDQPFSTLQTNIRLEKNSDIVALVDTGEQIYGNSMRVGEH